MGVSKSTEAENQMLYAVIIFKPCQEIIGNHLSLILKLAAVFN